MRVLSTFSFAVLSALGAATSAYEYSDVCEDGSAEIDVVTSIIYSPLVISGFVPSPTTIAVNDQVTMTVIDCPTSIETTTYCSYVTVVTVKK